jgi:hypothetical protein
MKEQFKDIEIECPKCKTKATVRANSMFDTIYSCKTCKNVIFVEKVKL